MIKKMEISELKVGMYIHALTRSEDEREEPFLNTILIGAPEEIEHFKKQGYLYAHIYIADDIEHLEKVEVDEPKPIETEPIETEPVEPEPVEPEPIVPEPEPVEPEAIEPEPVEPEPVEPEPEATLPEPVAAPAPPAPPVPSFENLPKTASFDDEIDRASYIRDEARSFVDDFMSEARAGQGVDSEKADHVVGSMVDSVMRNKDALLSLSKLKDYDNYTFGHSVNVCIIALALGRHMGFPKDVLHQLGVGTILHDIGKTKLPEGLLNKMDELSPEDITEIRNHVDYSIEILNGSVGITDQAISVAAEHHERFDGSGYPLGLAGRNISLFGRLSAVADVYDAMTTIRVYGDTPLPSEAVKRLFKWKGTHFDPKMVDNFVACFGIYPIGSYVRLNTGEAALVKTSNSISLLKPRVIVVLDDALKPMKAPLEVDLMRDKSRSIIGAFEPDSIASIDLPTELLSAADHLLKTPEPSEAE